MAISVFDLFKVGIGPSSSHTVGPMRAALAFVQSLSNRGLLSDVRRIQTGLYGSLALTGRGHATDKAILLGLSGERPDTVDPDQVDGIVASIRSSHSHRLGGTHSIPFNEATDLIFHEDESLPRHPNGMQFRAFDESGSEIQSGRFYSIGGGFIVSDEEAQARDSGIGSAAPAVAHDFASSVELLAIGKERE